MTRPFLFGGTTSNQSQSKYLVEFKAGKMTMQGNMVHPDKRKGVVYINQTEDSLMHFCWKDRTTGAVEDDLIIFPDDVEFKRVPQCTTGRVYVLKFKSSSRKCFYWMQEPKTDKDEEYCNKVNEYLNNPPIPGSTRSSALGGGGSSSQGGGLHSELSNLGDSDLQNLLNNMSQQQLMQLLAGGVGGMTSAANLGALLGGSRTPSGQSCTSVGSSNQNSRSTATEATATTGPSDAKSSSTVPTPSDSEPQSQGSVTSTTSATPASGTSTQGAQIQLSDLQNILSGLNVQSGDRGAAAAAAEALQPLLTNQEFMSRVRELLPTVADSAGSTPTETVSEQLRTTVQSPQFQQALSGFSAALQSGQLGPLMQQFGMPQEVIDAANSGDMEAFIRALQNSRDKKDPGGDKDDKGNDDEEMSLD